MATTKYALFVYIADADVTAFASNTTLNLSVGFQSGDKIVYNDIATSTTGQ
jgi:hypothetical protein